MQIQIRLNATLAQHSGRTRLPLELADDATVADAVRRLGIEYPAMQSTLSRAVPFVAGQHVELYHPLQSEQELFLVTPVAGGSRPHLASRVLHLFQNQTKGIL